jgi:hypothetical protein
MRGLWRITGWPRRRRARLALAAAERQVARFPTIATRRPHGLPGELVVSLTSYPARFPTLAKTLKCVLDQTVAPDRTILWLGHGDRGKLPADVLDLQPQGLEIRDCDDLRSFTKIIPALDAFPDAFILTVDDDVAYDPRLIETLVQGFDAAAPSIVARRVHLAHVQNDGRLTPYRSWALNVADTVDRGSCDILFLTGVGGVLYPPRSLDPMVLDRERFGRLCPHGDDIWLFWMARRAGTVVRRVGDVRPVVNWTGSQEVALMNENLLRDRNDVQIRAMEAELGPA